MCNACRFGSEARAVGDEMRIEWSYQPRTSTRDCGRPSCHHQDHELEPLGSLRVTISPPTHNIRCASPLRFLPRTMSGVRHHFASSHAQCQVCVTISLPPTDNVRCASPLRLLPRTMSGAVAIDFQYEPHELNCGHRTIRQKRTSLPTIAAAARDAPHRFAKHERTKVA
jgi:hypothetical protein